MGKGESKLEQMTIQFSKVEDQEQQQLTSLQQQVQEDLLVNNKKKMITEIEEGDLPLKSMSLVNIVRSQKIPFQKLYDMILDPDVSLSFNQIEELKLTKINIAERQCTIRFRKCITENPRLRKLKLEECAITNNYIREELSGVLMKEMPHLQVLDIDLGFKLFFVGDQASKVKFLSPTLQQLRIRALFESPQSVVHLLRQIEENHKLFKLELEYLGTEIFQAPHLRGIKDYFEGKEKSKSLKSFELRVPRDLFRMNFDRTIRDFDLN